MVSRLPFPTACALSKTKSVLGFVSAFFVFAPRPFGASRDSGRPDRDDEGSGRPFRSLKRLRFEFGRFSTLSVRKMASPPKVDSVLVDRALPGGDDTEFNQAR